MFKRNTQHRRPLNVLAMRPDAGNRNLYAARLAVTFFFLLNGTLLGSWFARIPDVQHALGLSNGALGLALLGAAAGALITMPATGWMIARWGSSRITSIGAVAQCAALVLPALAPAFLSLVSALFALGCATGMLDVSMNVHGAAVERRYKRPIMTTFHAFYSAGGLLGAMAGGVAASLGIAPAPHLLAAALLFAVAAMMARSRLLPPNVDANSAGPAFARPSRALARISIVAFCVVLAEGAMGDWSAVYLRNTLTASTAIAAGGYAAFSLTMTVGRLVGGHLTAALGEVAVVRLGGALVALGLSAALLTGHPVAAILGFGCVGLGLSCAFPVTISAAGRIPGLSPSAAIAAINTAGYTGFLAGPPLIGIVAESAGMRGGLGLLVLVGIVMLALAGAVGRGTRAVDHRDRRHLVVA